MFLIISSINLKKIFISSDHAGYKLKEEIKKNLSKNKMKFHDLGPKSSDSVDYPDYAHKVAKKVKVNKKKRRYFDLWFRHRHEYCGK